MSDLRVVQLQDENRNPITPYTAAASVYVNVNEEWTNVETMLGAMDIDAIHDAQQSALEDIDEQRIASVNKIQEEGDSYRNDINSLSGTVKTLDEKVFPLTITTSITGNTDTLEYSYNYSIKEYGQAVSGANITVNKTSNDGNPVQIYAGTNSSNTLTNIAMSWGRDIFKVNCQKGSKSSEKPDTRYLCLYGSYGETMSKDTLKNKNVMARKVTSSISFTCTVNTTNERKYIWVAVPKYLSISKITSQGFEVTMNNYVEIVVEDGGIPYRCYRSQQPLSLNTWNLTIS